MSCFPTSATIWIWICIAHIWLFVSTIVFMQLEGCAEDIPLNHVDVYLNDVLNNHTDLTVVGSVKSKEFLKFKEGYNEALSREVYWRMRNEFNDAAKVYIFVLSSYTTIGNFGMYPQTWQSRLYYILSLPLGCLFYCFMLHNIAVEAFEIFAYAAVSIFPKKFSMWTIDERELYEKLKVTFLFSILLTALIFILALLSIINFNSYVTGLYSAVNLIFTVSPPDELLSFTFWGNKFVAAILTFVYFISLQLMYMILYSIFILFRYNKLSDVVSLITPDNDSLLDVDSAGDDRHTLDNNETKEVLYYNAKNQSKQFNTNVGFHSLPPYMELDQALEVPEQRKTLHKKRKIANLKLKIEKKQRPISTDTPEDMPNIQVTQPTPVSQPDHVLFDDTQLYDDAT